MYDHANHDRIQGLRLRDVVLVFLTTVYDRANHDRIQGLRDVVSSSFFRNV